MNVLESVPIDNDSLVKSLLVHVVEREIKEGEHSEQGKIELMILKKFLIVEPLRTIFKRIQFKVINDDDEEFKGLELTFSDELKQYVDNEYKKYLENNNIKC